MYGLKGCYMKEGLEKFKIISIDFKSLDKEKISIIHQVRGRRCLRHSLENGFYRELVWLWLGCQH